MSGTGPRVGQLWDCGDWGRGIVTKVEPPSKGRNARVELRVTAGGISSTKGEEISLLRNGFEANYKRL